MANRARRAMPAALAACSRALRANTAATELVGHGARASRRAAHARGALSGVDRKEKPAETEKKRGSDSHRALDDGRRCCESARTAVASSGRWVARLDRLGRGHQAAAT